MVSNDFGIDDINLSYNDRAHGQCRSERQPIAQRGCQCDHVDLRGIERQP
jgi:hypothetical protein